MKPINNTQAANYFYCFLIVIGTIIAFVLTVIDYGLAVALTYFGLGFWFIGIMALMIWGPDLLEWFWNRYIAENHHMERNDDK